MAKAEKGKEEKAAPTAKATASRPKESGGTVENYDITPSANGGYSVRVRTKQPERKGTGGRGNMPSVGDAYRDPDTRVFADKAGLIADIEKTFT